MAVQEEPKEPHVSSVLPWIILHRIIWQEEDAFRSLCQQQQLQSSADEGGGSGSGGGLGPCGPASGLCPGPCSSPRRGASLTGFLWHLDGDRGSLGSWLTVQRGRGLWRVECHMSAAVAGGAEDPTVGRVLMEAPSLL